MHMETNVFRFILASSVKIAVDAAARAKPCELAAAAYLCGIRVQRAKTYGGSTAPHPKPISTDASTESSTR
jgi:hypothetical protein